MRSVGEKVVGGSRAESIFKEERFLLLLSSGWGGENDSCFDIVCCSF